MLRRLLALIVLVGVVGAAWYVWSGRGGTTPAFATGLGSATDRLGRVGTGIQDAKLTASVRTALTLNRNLEPYDIDVRSDRGVVTLSGSLARPEHEQAALDIAAAVPDVRQVVDQLRVDPGTTAAPGDGRTVGEALDDRALEAKIRLAFTLNRHLEGSAVDVRAFRRGVTLAGDVATAEQRQKAISIAQQTPNVLGVSDQIRVGGQAPAAPGDAAGAAPTPAPEVASATAPEGAAAAAEKAIAANPNVAPYALKAAVAGGRLVLSGRVRTGAEKDLAGALAREASGLPLDNAVDVRP